MLSMHAMCNVVLLKQSRSRQVSCQVDTAMLFRLDLAQDAEDREYCTLDYSFRLAALKYGLSKINNSKKPGSV